MWSAPTNVVDSSGLQGSGLTTIPTFRQGVREYTPAELFDPGSAPSPGGCRISIECVSRPSFAPYHCGIHLKYWQNGSLIDRRYHAWGCFKAEGCGGCEIVSGRPPSTRDSDLWVESDSYDWPLSKCLCIENATAALNAAMRGGADNYQVYPRNSCCGAPGCNSNYSVKCVLRSCGLSVAWNSLPIGWDHRMQKCVDRVVTSTGDWGMFVCYCRKWVTVDTSWCGP